MSSVDPLSGSLVPDPRSVPLHFWVLRMERYYEALQHPPHPLWRELLSRGPRAWRRWVQKGLFHRIEHPLVFLYRQRFRAFGRERERWGLWVASRCGEEARTKVLPHEDTFEEGRRFYEHLYLSLELLPDPVHLLTALPFEHFTALRERYAHRPPMLRVQDNYQELHEIWPVDDETLLSRLDAKGPFVVADGHHRWEASLSLAREGLLHRRPVVLTSIHDPGLLILPTHRLLKGGIPKKAWKALEGIFTVREEADLPGGTPLPGELWWLQRGSIRVLRLHPTHQQDPRGLYSASHSLPYSRLETALLHEVLLPRLAEAGAKLQVVGYERYIRRALERLESGTVDHVVLLPPTHPQSVLEVAFAGERMPQKSTDFYPKLVAGLILTPL